jgi:hypothetical protein
MSPSMRISVNCVACIMCTLMCGLGAASASAAGDANVEACTEFTTTEASPGFRSFLPDCRAYEMVTPPYKGGVPPEADSAEGSADGEHRLGRVFGGFDGTGNDEYNAHGEAVYEFSRTSQGWVTEALDPPASLASRSGFITASSDLSHSLWNLEIQPAEGEEVPVRTGFMLAVREVTPGGTARFTDVGPAQHTQLEGEEGNLTFRGASADLGHIVMSEARGGSFLWPGDATVSGESLYEYDGTGEREPVLVGVKNSGPLVGSTDRNEHAELASVCGTVLGSAGEGSAYNAVSANGSVVYFTAQHAEGCSGTQPAVNELYARINGDETIDISEPSLPTGECTGACASAPLANAVFEGASETGSRAFFLTTQPLLNVDEAGAGTGQDLYEAELGSGSVKRLVQVSHDPNVGEAAEVQGVARVSEDGSHVYFVAKGVLTATPNGEGEAPQAGADNLYLFDSITGSITFVGRLLEADAQDWATEDHRPVQTNLCATGEADCEPGRFLIFESDSHFAGVEDTSTVRQVFEYDAQTHLLVRVSTGQKSAVYPEGFGDDGNATEIEEAANILSPEFRQYARPAEATSVLSLSADGMVVFGSDDALTPLAVEHHENVYEFREGNVYLISPGDEDAPLDEGTEGQSARSLGTDESGDDVFFASTESLVPQDVDTQSDWYDARVGGGFPAPVASPGCVGEACQAPGGVSLTFGTPSSAEFAGAGNVPKLIPALKLTIVKRKSLTRAQKLSKALVACRRLSKRRKAACTAAARRKYGPVSHKPGVKKTDRRAS